MPSRKRSRNLDKATKSTSSKRARLENDSAAETSTPASAPSQACPRAIPTPTNAHLQTLPAEVWHRIFENLVPVPFEEIPRDRVYSPLGGIEQQTQLHLLDENNYRRQTLVALSRTCKCLRPFVIPRLYRNIMIGTPSQLWHLWRSLVVCPERRQHVGEITYCLAPPKPLSEDAIELREIRELVREKQDFEDMGISQHDEGRLQELARATGLEADDLLACARAEFFFLPVLALTPKILSLNITISHRWLPMLHVFRSCPLIQTLMGIRPELSLTGCRSNLKEYFDRYPAPQALGPTRNSAVFPPPFLKDIKLYRMDTGSPRSLLMHHIRVFQPRESQELLEATQDVAAALENVLGKNQDIIGIPSRSLSRILRSGPAEYMAIRRYLERIREVDVREFLSNENPANTWRFWVDHMLQLELPKDRPSWAQRPLQGGYYGRDFFASVDQAVEKSKHSATRFLIQSHAVTAHVADFLRFRNPKPYPPEAREFTIEMDYIGYFRRSTLTSLLEKYSLAECIRRRFSNLRVLRMLLYPHIDNRKQVFADFNPARFPLVQSLTITIEALWGPVERVMNMLEGRNLTRPIMIRRYGASESRPMHNSNMTALEEDGVQILDPWEETVRAVNRIPFGCRELCVQDWFTEYTHMGRKLTYSGEEARDRDARDRGADLVLFGSEEIQELETAVLNGTVQARYRRLRHYVIYVPSGSVTLDFSLVDAINRILNHSTQPLEDTVYRYPTYYGNYRWGSLGVNGPLGFNLKGASDADEEELYNDGTSVHNVDISRFTRRYIRVLVHGLRRMCLERKRNPLTYELEPPLIVQQRPNLRKITFVYTLRSQLPHWDSIRDRSDDPTQYARKADYLWRQWYHSKSKPGSVVIGGYEELRCAIKEKAGIEFEVFENRAGNIPPDVIDDEDSDLLPKRMTPASPSGSMEVEISDSDADSDADQPPEAETEVPGWVL